MNLKDFLDFVEFIKNVDKYEARVQTLKDENTRLETNIRLTSEVAEIAYTKELTAKLYEQAKLDVDAAKAEASAMKEKAKGLYDKRLADVAAREADVREKQQVAAETLKQAQDLNTKLNVSLAKQLEAAESKDEELKKALAEVNSRLSKLKSVMG